MRIELEEENILHLHLYATHAEIKKLYISLSDMSRQYEEGIVHKFLTALKEEVVVE